jgi:hypothetical protein
MRESYRYNPPWERYTGTNYKESADVVKRKIENIAILA